MCLPSLPFPEADSLDGVAVHDEGSSCNSKQTGCEWWKEKFKWLFIFIWFADSLWISWKNSWVIMRFRIPQTNSVIVTLFKIKSLSFSECYHRLIHEPIHWGSAQSGCDKARQNKLRGHITGWHPLPEKWLQSNAVRPQSLQSASHLRKVTITCLTGGILVLWRPDRRSILSVTELRPSCLG